MIQRIVCMKFREEHLTQFLQLFEEVSPRIRQFPGCTFLQLHQDAENPTTLFTISHWNSANDLENYRSSSLFASTWKITKSWFGDKPEAWSLLLKKDLS